MAAHPCSSPCSRPIQFIGVDGASTLSSQFMERNKKFNIATQCHEDEGH